MVLCTECYVQRDGQTLMLYRNKKADDINEGKWIGIGGKFEHGESPEQCLVREVQEETGLILTDFQLRGL
ncbi:MAG: NUDIX domain-containing protein, partial [Coriobacteriia bacterium]|nr:NUDIX domain-containing protein [Coriobacteriia bacterium]